MNYKIYALTTSTQSIRYIGYTKHSLNRRLNGHRNEARRKDVGGKYERNTYKDKWFRKYYDEISIILIEENISSLEEILEREKYWIKYYRDNGYNLVNSTDGGDGTVGYKLTEEHKQLLRDLNKGKTLSEEHKQKISNSHKGKKMSNEQKELLSKMSNTPEARYKVKISRYRIFLERHNIIFENNDTDITEKYNKLKSDIENEKLQKQNEINELKNKIKEIKEDEYIKKQILKDNLNSKRKQEKIEKERLKIEHCEDLVNQGLMYKFTDKNGKTIYKPLFSEESKQKMSNSHKGKVIPEETKLKMSESIKEYYVNNPKSPLTDEQKQNLREKNLGKKQSKETIEKRAIKIRGENSGTAKITEKDVIEIRRLIETNELTRKQVAEKYNLEYSTVCKIYQRKLWGHI
jgi:hypothetical protein